MVFESKSYITMTYEFPCPDVVGNLPGRSVAMMPFNSSNDIAVTSILCSLLRIRRGGSSGGYGSISSFMMSLIDGFVDLIPFLIICMCPIDVDMDFGRCFLIALLVSPGNDVSQSLSIALQSVLTGRDPGVALRNAINLVMVGWW
jgi:hypothetical protein